MIREKLAENLQDRDNEAGECAACWAEGHEPTMNYYRESADQQIAIFKEMLDEIPDAQDITGKPTGYIKRKAIKEELEAKE